MTQQETGTIPARCGKAVSLAEGRSVKLINTYGEQVVDTWAFSAGDIHEFMSMEHTRSELQKIIPDVGDSLLTNHRRPILSLAEDTSPGIHDTLCAACDRYRYELLGVSGYYDNCTDNLAAALAEMGLAPPTTPGPLNLFMNRPVSEGRRVDRMPPASKPGDYVVLRAEMDCTVVFSACPQNILPTNGPACTPRGVHYQIV